MYRTKELFPYAADYYAVFPAVLPADRKQPQKGTFVFADNYTLYFKENTPKEVIKRLSKDFAEIDQKENIHS